MSLEIEGKFRIKMPPKAWLRSRENLSVTGLVQCYLTARPGWERRVRQATNALTGEVRCTLTEKTEEAGLIRTELEKEISPSEYAAGGDAARYAASLQGALGVPLQGAHHRDRLLPLLGKRSNTGGGAFRPR